LIKSIDIIDNLADKKGIIIMISIVIPSKDEPYLAFLVDSIHNTIDHPHEILVQNEPGLASAVLHGIKKAKGEIVAVLDADGSHDPKDLKKMINLTKNYQLVVGSRYIEGGKSKDFFSRRFLSHAFCRIARVLLNLKINDPMSGFVVVNRKVFKNFVIHPVDYKFLLEMIVKSNGSLKIFEYPITFERRKMGYSKTGVTEGIRTIGFIMLLFLWKSINPKL
jgi:dolichol-phosphate mannosyltransferase